jgi:hypothetical protein
MHAVQLWCHQVKLPNLKLKTQPIQLSGSLPLDLALPAGMEASRLRMELVTAVKKFMVHALSDKISHRFISKSLFQTSKESWGQYYKTLRICNVCMDELVN